MRYTPWYKLLYGMMQEVKEKKAVGKRAYDTIKKIEHLFPGKIDTNIYIYEQYAVVHIHTSDPITFEIHILSSLSKILSCKWEKRVEEHEVVYVTIMEKLDLYVHVKTTNTCLIKKYPTGKTTKVGKWVEVEEPQYDYVVDCKEVN